MRLSVRERRERKALMERFTKPIPEMAPAHLGDEVARLLSVAPHLLSGAELMARAEILHLRGQSRP